MGGPEWRRQARTKPGEARDQVEKRAAGEAGEEEWVGPRRGRDEVRPGIHTLVKGQA